MHPCHILSPRAASLYLTRIKGITRVGPDEVLVLGHTTSRKGKAQEAEPQKAKVATSFPGIICGKMVKKIQSHFLASDWEY